MTGITSCKNENHLFFKIEIALVSTYALSIGTPKYIKQILTDIKGHYNNGQSVSSVAQSCLTLCDPMNCSTSGLPVHRQLPEFTQTHVHRVSDAIQPSHPLSSPSPPAPQSLLTSESFPKSQLFSWGGQSTGVSALASFPPKNTQDWSLEW